MWNKINTYMPWEFIEFILYLTLFKLVSEVFHNKDISLVSMVSGAALYLAICNRHKAP